MKKKLVTFSIFLIILLAAAGYYFYSAMQEKKNPTILVIEGRNVRANEFKEFRPDGKPCESFDKCMDKFIEMQILVSEGLKMNLDIRESIKSLPSDVYNEKLASLTLEEKFKSIESKPTKDELDSYLRLHKGLVTIATYKYKDLESAKSGGDPSGKISISNFEDLTGVKAYMIGMLAPTEKTMPFKTDEGYEIIQLDMVEQNLATIENISDDEKKQISEKLEKDKKAFLFEKWKSELRQKANIKTTESLKNLK